MLPLSYKELVMVMICTSVNSSDVGTRRISPTPSTDRSTRTAPSSWAETAVTSPFRVSPMIHSVVPTP